ncbi:hypothetical protein T06_3096 [Trichinella sp. T6]|nr:hypothetical protein T06_3096 [Trichinella sp. T6]
MHSEFEAALTAILLGAVHRFLSAFKVNAFNAFKMLFRLSENILMIS